MNAIKNINMSAIPLRNFQWEMNDWSKINRYVKRLRQRIFRAEQLGQKRKVRKLQRLMLKSKANLLVSIRKVTQKNKGKKTPGVDGYIATNSKERQSLFHKLCHYNIKLVQAVPAKRIYIPKKNKKLRSIGIPIIIDRVYQNVAKNALEPAWEWKFEATMYGFRPKRSTADAISQLHIKLRSRSTRKWIFEGDFKGCFDNLSQEYIMECIKDFPAKDIIYKWLKAGYIDKEVYNDTNLGTQQGGSISPLLSNIALCGMDKEIGVKYNQSEKYGNYLNQNSIGIIKFADDFVILCKTKETANTMFVKLEPYLNKRGLTLALEKTKVVNIEDGFDFLGFNLKQYKTKDGLKLLIKPSNSSVKKAKEQIKEIFSKMRGNPVGETILKLNPVIRGIGNYWSTQVSKSTYHKIDNYLWTKTVKHLAQLHPKKSWKWKKDKYFKPDHTGVSKGKYILTDPKNIKNQLIKMAWIPIERHNPIKHTHRPDDPALNNYFEERDKRIFCKDNVMSMRKIAKRSNYKCRICNQSLVGDEKLRPNHIIPIPVGGQQTYSNSELLHQTCKKQHQYLLIKYGGGRDLNKIRDYIEQNNIDTKSTVGINRFKRQFRKFKYQVVGDK